MSEEKVLTVIKETEILGKKIQMYNSVENPLFLASDVADWIDYQFVSGKRVRNTSKMLYLVDDDEKSKAILGIQNKDTTSNSHGGLRKNVEMWFLTEDGLYEVCMQSRKPIAKQMKKEIKSYLKSIRLTGAAIPEGREEEMVSKYFPSFSKDTQAEMVNDLIKQNRELKQFYDDLMNTEELMSINTMAKELEIGEYTLFDFLRKKKIFFYGTGKINMPYERFRREGKFTVKETYCSDGKLRSVTYATKKGLDYVRRLLKKSGFYASSKA